MLLRPLARYFAWEVTVFRYGPYTRDAEVIRLTEAVRDDFASSAVPVGPFCFFRSEQHALAAVVLERREGNVGVEFDTITLADSNRQLTDPPALEMVSVKQTRDALRTATRVENLSGRDRLAHVHNHLVDLLSYIEMQEGFSLFPGERSRASLDRRVSSGLTTRKTEDRPR